MRENAAAILAELGATDAIPNILSAADKVKPADEKDVLLRAIATMGLESVEQLFNIYVKEEIPGWQLAWFVLEEHFGESCVPIIEPYCDAEDPRIAVPAAQFLLSQRVYVGKATAVLYEYRLTHIDPHVRRTAVFRWLWNLKEAGGPAVPFLRKMAQEEGDPGVAEEIASTLGRIGRLAQGAIPELRYMYQRFPDESVRSSVWVAIRKVGGTPPAWEE